MTSWAQTAAWRGEVGIFSHKYCAVIQSAQTHGNLFWCIQPVANHHARLQSTAKKKELQWSEEVKHQKTAVTVTDSGENKSVPQCYLRSLAALGTLRTL